LHPSFKAFMGFTFLLTPSLSNRASPVPAGIVRPRRSASETQTPALRLCHGPCHFYQGGIDPGFGIPPTAEGTSFTGTFTAPPNLEHLLLATGGTVHLQIHGVVGGMQDPLLSATLQNVTPIHFTALCTGRTEIPPNTSPHRAGAQFTLTGNILAYTFTADPGFTWALAGIYGPGTQHPKTTELFAQLDTSFGVIIVIPGQPTAPSGITYSGSVNLTDQQATDLKRGLCYVNFLTAQHPKGEIRGQILYVPAPHNKRPNEPWRWRE
jgi:hypothetical protein